MERKIYLLIPALLLTLSCNKKLDTVPGDFLTPINYYQTPAQLNSTLIGVYDDFGKNGTYYNDLLSYYSNDEAIFNTAAWASIATVQIFNYSTADAVVNDLWTTCYDGINRANVLLDVIKQNRGNLATSQTDAIKGQALFLRAYYYFLLVEAFGDVPLRLEPLESVTNVSIERTATKDVYAQILSDMTTAEPLVSTAAVLGPNSCGTVSRQTVDGILARVCLTMAGFPLNDVSKYQDALTWSKKVIDLGQNSLNPDFSQIFINEAQNIYDTKEVLWEVEFFGNVSDAHREEGFVGVRNGVPSTNATFPGYGYSFLHTTSKLFNSYPVTNASTLTTNDLRRDRTVATYYWNDANPATSVKTYWTTAQIYDRWPGKWRRDEELVTPRYKNGNGTNFPILRYSDVLLMYAEAENHVNGATNAAYNAINQVRERAYGTGSKVSAVAITNAGSGYTTAPVVTIAASSSGVNYPATATATISGGKVTAINIMGAGAFYSTPPTITIAAPASGVTATATCTIIPIIVSQADLTPGLSKDDFFKELQDERMRELAFELVRYHDLKRWGILISAMQAYSADVTANAPTAFKFEAAPGNNIQQRHLLYPIPSREISLNNLITQNPGW